MTNQSEFKQINHLDIISEEYSTSTRRGVDEFSDKIKCALWRYGILSMKFLRRNNQRWFSGLWDRYENCAR